MVSTVQQLEFTWIYLSYNLHNFKQKLQKGKVKCCGGENFIKRQTPRLSTIFVDNPPTPDLRD